MSEKAAPHTDETPRSKRLSMSEILELALTRRKSSSITISRSTSGDVAIDVQIATGDGAETVEEAETKAAEIYGRLAALYPPAEQSDSANVELTRNAKGETQVGVVVRAGGALTSADAASAKAVEMYDTIRARYPMADGNTAKPGTVDPSKKVGGGSKAAGES